MTVVGTSTLTSVPPLLERAKLGFVVALRNAFSSSMTNESLRYSQDESQTKIKIYTAHPLRLEFYPSIVISTGGGDMSVTYLVDDFIEEVENQNRSEVVFAGRIVFTMSITVLSNSTLERERIIDHLIIFLRHLFRPNIHAFGIEYTKGITIGPEMLTEVENRPVYEQVVDVPCYMEYEAKIDQSALDSIRKFTIDVQAETVTI